MKKIEKWKALFAVADAKTSDEPDPLALALIEAERNNLELIHIIQAQRVRIDELVKQTEDMKSTIGDFIELLEVYVIESDLSKL